MMLSTHPRRVCRLLLLLVCWMLLPTWSTVVGAAGFIRLEMYRGKDLPDDPQAVAASESGWTSFDGALSGGFREGPLWIRAWAADQTAHREWRANTIRLGMPYLDDVRLYRRSPDGDWMEWVRGDRYARSEQGQRDRMFLIPAPPSHELMLIRVESTSTLALSVQHLGEDELEQQLRLEHLVVGLFLGLWLLLLAWSSTNALLYRDRVSAWFAGYQFSATLMGLGLSGYSALVLPAGFLGVSSLTSFTVLTSTLLGLMFHRSLLMELTMPHRLLKIMDVTLILAIFNLALWAVGWERHALRTNAWLVVLSMGLYLPAAFFMLMRPGEPARRGVLVVYGVLSLFVLGSMIPVLGGGNFGVWSLYTTVLHTMLSGVTLGALLLLRHSRMVRNANQNLVLVQAADLENRRISADRDDKARLLSMLAHELRTPLSVLRMALDSYEATKLRTPTQARLHEHGQRAIRDMNDVIERTVQADRMERGEWGDQVVECSVAELIQVVLDGLAERSRVQVAVPEAPLLIKSDAFLLKTLLGNFIDNALKYSPADSVVQVTMQEQSRAARSGMIVRVVNLVGGAGRPDPDRVFAKYYRSEGARRRTGSGLGLFIVQGLAQRLGAQVALLEAGEGAGPDSVCFEVWMPHESPVDHRR